jgi:hypothetical protein
MGIEFIEFPVDSGIESLMGLVARKIPSQSMHCILSLVSVSFAMQKLFTLMQSHCSFFLLDADPFEFWFRSSTLYLYVPVYFLVNPGVLSKFQALYKGH